jgi:hypothetical protein
LVADQRLVTTRADAAAAASGGLEAGSMAAALGYRPDGTSARLCFHLQADSYDTDRLIGVLEQLAGFYRGQRVVLVWDGLSSHWSHRMTSRHPKVKDQILSFTNQGDTPSRHLPASSPGAGVTLTLTTQ